MGRLTWPKLKKHRFFLVLLLVLLLIGCGVTMVVRVFGHYEDIILENQDDQLRGLARSVDRSLDSYLDQYAKDLSYVTHRSEFLQAEETYLSGGGAEALAAQLTDSLLNGHHFTSDLLCLRGEDVLLSSSGQTVFSFPHADWAAGAGPVQPCIAEDGTVYLAFLVDGSGGLRYAALLDLRQLYQSVAGGLTAGTEDHIFLLDAGGQALLHQSAGEIRVDLISELSDGFRDLAGVEALARSQAEGTEASLFYQVPALGQEKAYTARMAAVPADGNNGVFAVGVSMDYDSVTRPIRLAAIRLTAYSSMVILGILLLAALTLWAGRHTARTQKELALLQEKNAAMEALNRQTQELAHHQRLETIGTLTSSIAHEFNNLLTPIMGYSILVLEQLPPEAEELYDNVLEIYDSSRKAKEIISRLSDLSRKNTALTFQDIAPDELVRKVLSVASPVRPNHVEVHTRLDCQDARIHGNEIQLSQMLLNLILNSYHALEPDGGILTVSTWSTGKEVFFRVADTGVGIPKEVLPHIFEPFYTTKERGKGTGLGLAIVHQVVEDHKASIQVDTASGQGTAITVRFPMSPTGEEDRP